MATTTSEADDIQRAMREVRAELREDVKELVVNAREMADWTTYVRAYPWLCLGVVAAAGYFLIPQRAQIIRPDAEGLIELAKRNKLVVKMEGGGEQKQKQGFVAGLLGLAASTLLQGGLAVATKQLSQALDAYTQPPAPRREVQQHHD
jgi:hypothetical protein